MECLEDAFCGEGRCQCSGSHLLFHLRDQGLHRRVAVEAGQQGVADHCPCPVDLLLASFAVVFAGFSHDAAVVVDLFADVVQAFGELGINFTNEIMLQVTEVIQ